MSGFHETLFPTDISYGSVGGPGFRTQINSLPSGQEERIQVWEGGRGQYDVSYGVKTLEQLAIVQNFYRARRGAAYGFLYKDFMDFTSNPTNPSHTGSVGERDQVIGAGDGSTTTFQLTKTYIDGGESTIRRIFKPVAGTVRIWVDGVEKVAGSDFTFSVTTGIVTFNAAPGDGLTVEASFEFYVPVRFGEAADTVLQVSVDAFDTGSIPSIPLVELLDPEGGYDNGFMHGGSTDLTINGNTRIAAGVAFAWRINAQSPGLSVDLPPAGTVPDGRPVFLIVNAGSNAFDLRDGEASPSTILSLAAGQAALCSAVKAPTEKVWYLV